MFVLGVVCAIYFSGVECLVLEPVDPWVADIIAINQHSNIETYPVHPVSKEDVTFYLVTSDNPDSYTKLDPSNLTAISNTTDKKAFLIHGWINNRNVSWMEKLTKAMLTRPNHVVIQVDWDKPAHQHYYQSSINIYEVARIVADVILDLCKNYYVSLDQFLLIGHSLGGQMLGSMGEKIINATGEELPRLIALDPAGPLFHNRTESQKLSKNDAKYIEVIHTNTACFGYKDPCGTFDDYPNGGSLQPGCITLNPIDTIPCDHMRSIYLYVEAILNQTALLSTRCDSWEQFQSNECDGVQEYMGDLTTNENGTFFCETNGESLFSK